MTGIAKEKEEHAIERLKLAAAMSERYYHKPLIITYSGGKDSECLLRVAQKSGIDFEIINNHTTVDAPCTVYHIRKVFDRIRQTGKTATIIMPTKSGKPTNMWKLIETNGVPTRIKRFCCKYLKERAIPNRYIATGIRGDESSQRKTRTEFEVRGKTKADGKNYSMEHTQEVFKDAVKVQEELGSADNEINAYDCNLITNCKNNNDVIANPIIDWTESDVWNYIHDEHIELNPIYEEFDRCGCILCPMGGYCQKKKQIELFPAYKINYIRAFQRHIEYRKRRELREIWRTGEECFDWWIEQYKHEAKGQMTFEDFY